MSIYIQLPIVYNETYKGMIYVPVTTFDEKLIRLGLNISHFRRIKSLTQEQLAEIVGVDRSYISKIEAPNMYTSFSMELLCKIAVALEVTESRLFDFT